MTMKTADDVIRFWFVEHGQEDWFGGKPEFDAELAEKFAETHARIAIGEGFSWRGTAEGRLAEIIVLDQFSRQLFRKSPKAFAQDGMALVLAQELVDRGLDLELSVDHRKFAYMPYMHSESLLVHEEAGRLFRALGNEVWLKHEASHATCLSRFGRYPARNEALGRVSRPEELAYLAELEARGG